MSLSARFLAYLVLLHALFAGVAFLLLRGSRAWLLAVEAVFAVSLLGGLALLRGLRRGLEPLEEASRLLAESDFTTRFREVGQPEVDRLIGVYNRMADELREERTRNQEQQGLLARILAVSPSGVVILDFEGRVAFANPAAGLAKATFPSKSRMTTPDGATARMRASRPCCSWLRVRSSRSPSAMRL